MILAYPFCHQILISRPPLGRTVAQFVYAFGQSNLGVLLALKGAEALKAMAMPAAGTVVGIVLLTAVVNIFVGSASSGAFWHLSSYPC